MYNDNDNNDNIVILYKESRMKKINIYTLLFSVLIFYFLIFFGYICFTILIL